MQELNKLISVGQIINIFREVCSTAQPKNVEIPKFKMNPYQIYLLQAYHINKLKVAYSANKQFVPKFGAMHVQITFGLLEYARAFSLILQ